MGICTELWLSIVEAVGVIVSENYYNIYLFINIMYYFEKN